MWACRYQSTSERNFQLTLSFLVQTRCNVARGRAREIWLAQINSTVLGIIGKIGGRGEEDCFFFVTTAEHVLGAVKPDVATTNDVFLIVIHHWRTRYENHITVISSRLGISNFTDLEVKGMVCSVFTEGQPRVPGLFSKNCKHM